MSYLDEGIGIAVKAGVDREKVLIDPGIGFGKTLEHNLAILERLDEFRGLGRPIVLGTSRKSSSARSLTFPRLSNASTALRSRWRSGSSEGQRDSGP
jgi:dihydropteroate synthase